MKKGIVLLSATLLLTGCSANRNNSSVSTSVAVQETTKVKYTEPTVTLPEINTLPVVDTLPPVVETQPSESETEDVAATSETESAVSSDEGEPEASTEQITFEVTVDPAETEEEDSLETATESEVVSEVEDTVETEIVTTEVEVTAGITETANNDVESMAETTDTKEETTTEETTTEEITTEEATTVEETTTTEPETTAQALTLEEKMINNSLLSTGNNSRMKAIIDKARSGQNINITWMGGSVTKGVKAGTEDIFAKLTSDFFQKNYCNGGVVNYSNISIAGTTSTLALIRSDQDAFSTNPDILFLEYAVNDNKDLDTLCLDGFIYKFRQKLPNSEIILLFSVRDDGYTWQEHMIPVGSYYDVPMISMRNAVWPEVQAGTINWYDWYVDVTHPTPLGHQKYTEFITNYFENVDKAPKDAPVATPAVPAYGGTFYNMKQMDSQYLIPSSYGNYEIGSKSHTFETGWHKPEGTTNEPFEFDFSDDYLVMVYRNTRDTNFGTATLYVDDVPVMSFEGYTSDGWDHPVHRLVYTNPGGKHKVKVLMDKGEEKKAFEILCFGMA